MNNNSSSSKNLVRDFEDSFTTLFGVLANNNCQQSAETEELKLSVEQCVNEFIERGRELEIFFMQKRFQSSSQKPEQIIAEDLNEIKSEIQRKDQLIERFNQKLETWQQILDDNYPLTQQPSNQPLIMQNNLQNAQIAHQPMNVSSIRQRSPIQQPIMQQQQQPNMSNMHGGLRQMMSPHSYQVSQPQTYTPQIPNQQQMMNMQSTNQHSPAMSQIPNSPQSTNYTPSTNQQSHLACLEQQVEKTTSNFGLDRR